MPRTRFVFTMEVEVNPAHYEGVEPTEEAIAAQEQKWLDEDDSRIFDLMQGPEPKTAYVEAATK